MHLHEKITIAHVYIFLKAQTRVCTEPMNNVSMLRPLKSGHYIRWQDGTLRTTFWNILVLKRLSAREGIVLIEQGTLVNRIIPVN